jgi:hypothetical protein
MKFASPPRRHPQPPPNDFHCFWLNRVDLRNYWSFNSLLPKNNIEYPQTGPPFHTINTDVFSKLNLCDLTRKTDVVIRLYHEVFGKTRTYFLKRNRLSVAKMIWVLSEMFHNVKLKGELSAKIVNFCSP